MRIVLLITLLESLAIASWLMVRRFRNQLPKLARVEAKVPVYVNANVPARATAALEASHWNFINNWQVEDQADDRGLTLGAVSAGPGSDPERRSFARRSHQQGFKTWSQARHD
ncbi:MAG TPA: hypothetical protein VHR36_14430 [Pyrinomonadaceae bacterium]|jgi:hypothetical protein|nr:hypothetical protein [Pyrinomonadaceae bacterium]